MPRLFIGIPVPESYHANVEAMAGFLAGTTTSKVAWTKPGNAHFTLKFLGNVEELRIGAIRDAIRSVNLPAFTMQAGGFGVFPDYNRPRAIWAAVTQGSEQLTALAKALEDALAPLGFGRMRGTYTPHLTIGRIKKNGQDDWKALLAGLTAEWKPFEAGSFVLWQSTLTPERAVYTPVETVALGG